MVLTPVQLDKISAILLNKVRSLEWYYFKLDLDRDVVLDHENHRLHSDAPLILQILKSVENVGEDSYIYREDQPDFKALVSVFMNVTITHPEILKDLLRRIFDANLDFQASEPEKGLMHWLNRQNRKKREKKFWHDIKHGHRSVSKNGKVILAEGDSWFEFPPFGPFDVVKDIIDHLVSKDHFSVLSRAAAGDWLSNMIYTGEYIEELPAVMPEAFLVSGGGNDLAGRRLAHMVRHTSLEEKLPESFITELVTLRQINKHPSFCESTYVRGLSLLNIDFFNFLNMIFLQYFILIYHLKIRTSKFKNVLIVTQGYDYPIPRKNTLAFKKGIPGVIAYLTGLFTGTGKWLHVPLNLKGITAPGDQKAVMYAMIYEFNEMLLQFTSWKALENVRHMDNRGDAQPEDWFDEIHLTSRAFAKVSQKFQEMVETNT